jgi:hypothetical protein
MTCDLGTLAADATGQLDVLGHDGDALCVDGTQVGVLEETDQVSLAGLLQIILVIINYYFTILVII